MQQANSTRRWDLTRLSCACSDHAPYTLPVIYLKTPESICLSVHARFQPRSGIGPMILQALIPLFAGKRDAKTHLELRTRGYKLQRRPHQRGCHNQRWSTACVISALAMHGVRMRRPSTQATRSIIRKSASTGVTGVFLTPRTSSYHAPTHNALKFDFGVCMDTFHSM